MTSLKLTSWQLTKLFAVPSRQKWAGDVQIFIDILLPPMMSACACVCDQWRRSVPMRSLLWQPRPSITTPAFSAGDHGAPHTSQLHTCHVSRVSTPALTIGSNIPIRGFVVKKVCQWKTAFQFQDEGTNYTIILWPCNTEHLYSVQTL